MSPISVSASLGRPGDSLGMKNDNQTERIHTSEEPDSSNFKGKDNKNLFFILVLSDLTVQENNSTENQQ